MHVYVQQWNADYTTKAIETFLMQTITVFCILANTPVNKCSVCNFSRPGRSGITFFTVLILPLKNLASFQCWVHWQRREICGKLEVIIRWQTHRSNLAPRALPFLIGWATQWTCLSVVCGWSQGRRALYRGPGREAVLHASEATLSFALFHWTIV